MCGAAEKLSELAGNQQTEILYLLLSLSSALKMEAVYSSKISVSVYQPTECHIPEDSNPYILLPEQIHLI